MTMRRTRKQTGGEAAKARATEARKATEDRWGEVSRVAESMKELRRRNHFAEQIRTAMEGSR